MTPDDIYFTQINGQITQLNEQLKSSANMTTLKENNYVTLDLSIVNFAVENVTLIMEYYSKNGWNIKTIPENKIQMTPAKRILHG